MKNLNENEKKLYDVCVPHIIDPLRTKVTILVAFAFYQKCFTNAFDSINIPDPISWLANEKVNREKWEFNLKFFNNLPEDNFKRMFFHQDKPRQYCKFMYENFPVGVGEYVKMISSTIASA